MNYYTISSNQGEEFSIMSWYAALKSDTKHVQMVGEELNHVPVWGLRASMEPVFFTFKKAKIESRVIVKDAVVGTFERAIMLYEIEVKVPTSVDFDSLVSDAKGAYEKAFHGKGIKIFYTRKYYESVSWNSFGLIPKRPLSSVKLDVGIENDLLADAKLFLKSSSVYERFGRPYKRVYCLHGPPGTGKTSVVTALASELGKDLAIFNVDSLRDDTFVELVSDMPTGAILLFEDIDSLFKKRASKKDESGMTFSTLLNSLDGVLHPRGSLIFMTTNHIEELDAALLRPGRVDRMINVGYAKSRQVSLMWEEVFPKGPALPKNLAEVAESGVSPAMTSEVLFQNRDASADVVAAALLDAWKRKSQKSQKPQKNT